MRWKGIDVGRNQIALVMRRASLQGVMGRCKRPRIERPDAIALDLVDRGFARTQRDQLWVTDIERHEALWNRAVMKGHRLRPLAGVR